MAPPVRAPHDPAPQTSDLKPGAYRRDVASPFSRAYAWLIDFGLLALLFYMLFRFTNGNFGNLGSPSSAPKDIIIFLAYFILPTGIWGRTVGKWVAGIVVVNDEGFTPGVAVAIPREVVGKVVSYAAFLLGLAWIVFDGERQGWHDKIAGTYVVNDPGAGAPILGKIFRRLR